PCPFHAAARLRHPPPFPTRRSSDLACAGRARFAEAVLRAAADAGVTVDPDSASFSDWVVELCPRVSLSLGPGDEAAAAVLTSSRSEEHTSELQSRFDLVCRLLLEKQ